MKWWLYLVATWVSLASCMAAANSEAATTPKVGLIEIKGAIGPSTASYIARAIDVAGSERCQALVIQLDTPGGLVDSTKEIIQKFYASSVPLVVYVSPAGAQAGSAGTFITMAAHVAAMAPSTSIGAAHPVALGGGSGGTNSQDAVMKEKLENFYASYIEAIAEKRGRNTEWARAAVRQSASITADQALKTNVIDLIAADLPELLKKIDGREVDGRTLKTAGANIFPIKMSVRERVFQLLWRPEVMMILMLIAIYGIIGELSNPGAILPGVAGAIALILALYMATVLPINVAGLALIVLAIGLFIADIFAPTHGVLTVGGIISFFLGSLMLFDKAPFRLSLAMIIPATIITALFFIFVVGAGLRAQLIPVKVGRETMLGKTVKALTPFRTAKADVGGYLGKVFVEGEYWNAVSDSPLDEGEAVEIVGIEGLTLKVKPERR